MKSGKVSYRKDNAEAHVRGYVEYLRNMLSRIDVSSVASLIEIFLRAREEGKQIFFIGNGGSASTASHFANDMAIGTGNIGKPYRALSLCDNVSVITAIGNDYGYDHIFTKQLEKLMDEGDVVVAISASGNSPNVVEAIQYAVSHGGVTAALTGFDGGRLKEIVRVVVHVPTEKGEYGITEDIHLVVDHVVSAFLKILMENEKG